MISRDPRLLCGLLHLEDLPERTPFPSKPCPPLQASDFWARIVEIYDEEGYDKKWQVSGSARNELHERRRIAAAIAYGPCAST